MGHCNVVLISVLVGLLFVSIGVGTAVGQSSVTEEFNETFGGPDEEIAYSVVQTSDGGYALGGRTNSFGSGNTDAWLVKTDSNGSKVFSNTFGGSDADYGNSAIQTSDEGYVIVGETSSYGGAWLVKTDENGDEQWNKTYTGVDYFESVIELSDGGYAVIGETTDDNALLLKTYSNGTEEFRRTFGGENNERLDSIIRTSDGGYALVGRTSSFGTDGSTGWLIKTDSNGNEKFNKTFEGRTYSGVKTSDGGYALSGVNDTGAWLIKTDSNGSKEFDKNFGDEQTAAISVVQTSDGGYAFGGDTVSFSEGRDDVWLIKTDANGNSEVNRTFGGGGSDSAQSIVQTSDGGLALSGVTSSSGSGGDDVWLIKLSAENEPPTANFTYSPELPTTGEEVTFNASNSSDPDGSTQTYEWTFGDGTTASGETNSHSYGSSGNYTVELTVTDDDGATDTTNTTVAVSSVDTTPNAEVNITKREDSFSMKIEDPGNLDTIQIFAPDGTRSTEGVNITQEGTTIRISDSPDLNTTIIDPADLNNSVRGNEALGESLENNYSIDKETFECVAFHDGYTQFNGTSISGDQDHPCHTPVVGHFDLLGELTIDASVDFGSFEDGKQVPITYQQGTYELVGTVDNSSEVIETVTVEPDSAFFEVNTTGTNQSVTEGDTLEITANVTNTGDKSDTQKVTLRDTDFAGQKRDDVNVTLAGGESNTSVTLSWNTEVGLNGTGNVTVSTENNSDQQKVTVQKQPEPAFFAVSDLLAPNTVVEGDEFSVNATVENTGDETQTQEVEFRLNGSGDPLDSVASLENDTVTLNGSENTTVEFGGISVSDAREYDLGIFSNDDNETAGLTVEKVSQPAFFGVNITDTNEPVTEGGMLEVTANVTNTGEASDTQYITLNDAGFEGKERDNVSLTLGGGESNGSVILSWNTESGVNGTDKITVSTDDDNDTQEVIIEEDTVLLPVNGFDNPPQDLNSDGLYRDINGDGSFNLGDVIALYENYQDDSVLNNHPELFNFNGQENPDDVTLGDVIALYEER